MSFSFKTVLHQGYTHTKKQIVPLLGIQIIAIIALLAVSSIVAMIVLSIFPVLNTVSGVIPAEIAANIGSVLLMSVLYSVYTKMGIVASKKKKKATLQEMAPTGKELLRYAAVFFISLVIVLLGGILLLIPGIIAAIHLIFAGYIIVEKKMSPWQAIKESSAITKGHRWNIFAFLIVQVLVLLGLMLPMVIVAIALPVALHGFIVVVLLILAGIYSLVMYGYYYTTTAVLYNTIKKLKAAK